MKKNEPEEIHIDCLDLKRRVQEQLRARTEGMTPVEEIEHFRAAARTGSLSAFWESLSRDPISSGIEAQSSASIRADRRD